MLDFTNAQSKMPPAFSAPNECDTTSTPSSPKPQLRANSHRRACPPRPRSQTARSTFKVPFEFASAPRMMPSLSMRSTCSAAYSRPLRSSSSNDVVVGKVAAEQHPLELLVRHIECAVECHIDFKAANGAQFIANERHNVKVARAFESRHILRRSLKRAPQCQKRESILTPTTNCTTVRMHGARR